MPVYKDNERNSWYCSFYYTDWQGVRHNTKKRGFLRKKDAQNYERDFLNKEQASCDMSFSALKDLYFNDMETRLRETTMDNKRVLFDTKILPTFGKMSVNKITPAHIRKWQAELIGQNYAPTYLKTINNQLSAIFNYAVRYYKLPENPVRIAGSMGKKKADEMEIWTLDEFKKFIDEVKNPGQKIAFEIMFWAGLRVGEVLALTPSDILSSDKMIDINKTTSRRGGVNHVYDPKTTKSFRKVPIPKFLYDEIIDYVNQLWGIKDTDPIFYCEKSTLNKALNYNAAKAGIKRIRVHDLRHSHCALLIEMGQPILLISERLGHESVDTTWNTYAHLYPNKGVQLADELEKMK